MHKTAEEILTVIGGHWGQRLSRAETLRSDVLFWENKLRRDKSDYAQRRWVKAKERLKLEEIRAENERIKIIP